MWSFGRLLLFYWRQVHLLWCQIRCIFDVYESLGLRKFTNVTFQNGGTSYQDRWNFRNPGTTRTPDRTAIILKIWDQFGLIGPWISGLTFTLFSSMIFDLIPKHIRVMIIIIIHHHFMVFLIEEFSKNKINFLKILSISFFSILK